MVGIQGKKPHMVFWAGWLAKKDCFFQIVWMGQPKGGRAEASLGPRTPDTQDCVHHHHLHVSRALCTLPQATSKHIHRRKLETSFFFVSPTAPESQIQQSFQIKSRVRHFPPSFLSPPKHSDRHRGRQSSKRGGEGNLKDRYTKGVAQTPRLSCLEGRKEDNNKAGRLGEHARSSGA